MSIAAFDTLAFTETLKEANAFSDEQAKAQVKAISNAFGQALDGQIATKEDLHKTKAELKDELHATKTELKDELHATKTELKGDITRLDKKIDTSINEVKSEQKLMKWMLGFDLALTVAIFFYVISGQITPQS